MNRVNPQQRTKRFIVVDVARRLIGTALLGAVLVLLPALVHAQDTDVPPSPNERLDPSEVWTEPDFLKSLPRVLDQPRSLMEPPVSTGVATLPPDEQPYFSLDPNLDPVNWSQPGWFADAQVAGVQPVVNNKMIQTVTTGLGNTVTVGILGSAKLNATVKPRFEVGYRLPAGFGAFAVSNTFLNTQGSGAARVPDGSAAQSSFLNLSYTDLDYISREFMPNDGWEMRWRTGVRGTQSHNGTTNIEPFGEAAAGSGVFLQSVDNTTWGAGVHFGVEIERRFGQSDFSLIGRADLGDSYMRIRQRYFAQTTTLTKGGTPDSGAVTNYFTNQLIILNAQAGLSWQPRSHRNVAVFLGYLNEHWWNVMANYNQGMSGDFGLQGVLLRGSFKY